MNAVINGQQITMTQIDLTRLSTDAAQASRHFGALMDRYLTAIADHEITPDEARGIQLEGAAAIVAISELMRGLDAEVARAVENG